MSWAISLSQRLVVWIALSKTSRPVALIAASPAIDAGGYRTGRAVGSITTMARQRSRRRRRRLRDGERRHRYGNSQREAGAAAGRALPADVAAHEAAKLAARGQT